MILKNIDCKKFNQEDVTGHQILNEFNLVAVNLGGPFVLAGMSVNWKMSELISTASDIKKEIAPCCRKS